MLIEDMLSTASPVLLMTNAWLADELKRLTEPKSFEVGDTETLGIVPSPVRATLYVPVSGSSEADGQICRLASTGCRGKGHVLRTVQSCAKGSSAGCRSLGELVGIGSGDVDCTLC